MDHHPLPLYNPYYLNNPISNLFLSKIRRDNASQGVNYMGCKSPYLRPVSTTPVEIFKVSGIFGQQWQLHQIADTRSENKETISPICEPSFPKVCRYNI
jgi:hypothetical protein